MSGGHLVVVLDGVPYAVWGEPGAGAVPFRKPIAITVRGDDEVYVVENHHDRIQLLTSDGAPRASWGSPGSAPGQLMAPMDVAVSDMGEL